MLPDSDAEKIGALRQVAEVMPIKLLMTSCQDPSEPITIKGINKKKFLEFSQYPIVEGSMENFLKNNDGALVGSSIAKRYGWKEGSNATVAKLQGIGFKISAIFSKPGSPDDSIILISRRYLQEATDTQGDANLIMVKPEKGYDVDEVCTLIEKLPLATSVTAQTAQVDLASSLEQLASVAGVAKYIVIVIGFITLLAVGNAISMATRDRSGEIGILRTLGFSSSSILQMVLYEGIILGLLGGIVGVLGVVGMIHFNIGNTIHVRSLSIELITGAVPLAIAISAVVLAAFIGSLIPALKLSRLKTVDAIRRED